MTRLTIFAAGPRAGLVRAALTLALPLANALLPPGVADVAAPLWTWTRAFLRHLRTLALA